MQADLLFNMEAIAQWMEGLEHTSDLCPSNEDQKAWDMALIIQPPTWAHITIQWKENAHLKQRGDFNSAIFIYLTG